MNLLNEFLNIYHQSGFLMNNYYEGIHNLKHLFSQNKFTLECENNSFFFYEKDTKLMHYFINENTEFKLKPSYVKIMFRNEKDLEKHKSFLEKNHFHLEQKNTQMVLRNKNLQLSKFDFIDKAKKSNYKEIYNFLLNFFDPNSTLDSSVIKSALKENNIILHKENKIIKSVLIFKTTLGGSYLEKIAVDKENLEHKNAAFALLNHFFIENQKAPFFKLFVRDDNEKAIKFYKRAGFEFNTTKLHFYRNF
ncbi:GNAT family N-acetyltransferase [Campylobacter coli]|uniref:GNAT family N-acetyltransferase n=1 Tax=Campylobacter coli TaxID=195 RepID=UPI0009318D62|nr:GNAT family N-acetyltransferase [Campylobacter coli]